MDRKISIYNSELINAYLKHDFDGVFDALKKGSNLYDVAFTTRDPKLLKYISGIDFSKIKDGNKIQECINHLKIFYASKDLSYLPYNILLKQAILNSRHCVVSIFVIGFYYICNQQKLDLVLYEEYKMAKNVDATMVEIILEGNCKPFIEDTTDNVLELIIMGVKDEILRKHPKYNMIMDTINNHKQETKKYLSKLLPLEIIKNINNYQVV